MEFLEEYLIGVDRPLLHAMAEVTVGQSVFVQGGFFPDLSDCIEASYGDAVLN